MGKSLLNLIWVFLNLTVPSSLRAQKPLSVNVIVYPINCNWPAKEHFMTFKCSMEVAAYI